MKPYRIIESGRAAVRDMIMRHYLHKWPGTVVAILALMDECRPVGALIFSLPPRETSIRYGGETWELSRLFVEDSEPRNTETWFISRAIKWLKKFHPEVRCVVSYADPSVGHMGVIYRAANFVSDGRTDSERGTPRFDLVERKNEVDLFGPREICVKYGRASHARGRGERAARTSKFRYVYWLDGSNESKRKP